MNSYELPPFDEISLCRSIHSFAAVTSPLPLVLSCFIPDERTGAVAHRSGPAARPIPPPAAVMAAVGSPFALAFRIIHSGPLTLATTLVPARRARFLMGLPGASARVSGSLPSFFRSACPTCKWPTMPGMRRRSGQRGRWSRSCRSSTIPLTLPVRRLAPYDAFKMQQLMLRSAPSFKNRDEAERRYSRICPFLTQQWYTTL